MSEENFEVIIDNDVLIVNPTINEVNHTYRVKFDKEYKNIKYFLQLCDIGDENDYYSYVFYENKGKTYCFFEYDNPQSMSFNTEIDELKEEEFLQKVADMDKRMCRENFGFTSCLEKYKNKKILESELNQPKLSNKKMKL